MNTPDTEGPTPRPDLPEGDTLQAQTRKIAAMLDDAATERGVKALIDKLTPLIRGQRLHNLVDLISLLSDTVDMSDDAMIQKMMKGYEDMVGTLWSLSNASRFAHNAASRAELPSLLGLLRVVGQEDVRRGLLFVLLFLGVLGKQMRNDTEG